MTLIVNPGPVKEPVVMPKLDDPCPKCGAKLDFGYGLMGGGVGGYVFCSTDDCDFFVKEQDNEGVSEGEEKP